MQLEDLVSLRKLVVGTATTTIGATVSLAADATQSIQDMEPSWLNLAIKLVTLVAGASTILAAVAKVYFDWRKDKREERQLESSGEDFDSDDISH